MVVKLGELLVVSIISKIILWCIYEIFLKTLKVFTAKVSGEASTYKKKHNFFRFNNKLNLFSFFLRYAYQIKVVVLLQVLDRLFFY